MATDETLNAKIRISGTPESELQSIAESFGDVASAAIDAAAGTDVAGRSFSDTEDEASGLSRALTSVSNSAASVSASMGAVGGSTEAAEEGLEDTKEEARGLNRQLNAIPASATAAVASLSVLDGMDPDMDIGTDVDDTITRRANISLGAIPNPMERVRGRMDDDGLDIDVGIGDTLRRVRNMTPTMQVDTKTDLSGLRSLPDVDVGIEDTDDLDSFRNSLREVRGFTDGISLDGIDDDSLIDDAGSVDELVGSLRYADVNAESTANSFDDLSGSARGMVDDTVAGATSVDELRDEIDDVGDRATVASSQIGSLSSDTRELVASQTAATTSSHRLADEIEDVGDEATQSALQVTALQGALAGVGASKINLGFFQTSLKTLGRAIPMVFSLAAALGGLATAAGGAAGALAGIFGGGLLAAGEARADQMEAMGEGPKGLSDATGMERSMMGVKDILSDLKESAYEALEPLRQPEFAEFSLDVLEGAVTLLGRISEGIASISGPVLDGFDMVADSFWGELPAIGEEMKELMMDIGPILRDITIGGIERLPGMLDQMRQTAKKVLPPLMDMADAFMDALPGIIAVGTGMLQFLIPALEGFFRVLAMLPLEWFGSMLQTAAKAAEPLMKVLGGLLGLGTIALIPGLGAMVGLLKAAVPYVLSLIAGLGTIGSILAGGLGVGVVLTLTNKWDNVIVSLIKGWNKFLDVMQGSAEVIAPALEGIVQEAANAVNWLIDKANRVPRVDIDPVPTDYEADVGLEDQKVDPQRGQELGKKMNSPLGGGNIGPSPSVETAPGTSMGGGDSYDQRTQNDVSIEVSGTNEDEQRVENAVRRGVKRANRKERLKNSGTN